MTFEEIPVEPRPNCPVCQTGGVESVHDVEYEATCSIG
jgi:adenylyltransferase/sulfurtransferase